jgi:hypothetical protein
VKLELQALKNAPKSYLSKEFSRLENLWVGEKKENQQKGSDFGAADKELKGLKEGTPEYKAALAKRSAAVVDPAKGTANGKKISSREQGWIDQIHESKSELTRFTTLKEQGKLKIGTPAYKEADNMRSDVINAQRNLGDFSQKMNTSEFSIINQALKDSSYIVFELNRILAL